MAADILLYKGTHVPVGEDQKQHLELARDIAAKFNHDYETELFPIIEPLIFGTATRVMSLKNGSSKMSKSDSSDLSRINMTDDADAIARKIKKAKTDADVLPSEPKGLEGRPEAANLVGIYAALAGIEVNDVLQEFGGQGFGAFKPALGELAVEGVVFNRALDLGRRHVRVFAGAQAFVAGRFAGQHHGADEADIAVQHHGQESLAAPHAHLVDGTKGVGAAKIRYRNNQGVLGR